MNKNTINVALMLVLLLSSGSAFAQADLDKPAINLTEKWSMGTSGWVTNSPLCGWTNGEFVIKFIPNMQGGSAPSISGGTGASANIFQGDYSRVEAVSFDIKPNNLTLVPRFYFIASSGREWSTPFQASSNGMNATVIVPFSYSSNWKAGFKSTTEANFAVDKKSVVEVGIYLSQLPDNPLQSLAVDNFKLLGPWTGPFSNGVPLAWIMENGLTNNFASAGIADSDNDNFNNEAEFLAGTDPNNSNSFFRVEIVRNSQGKMALRWSGNRDVNYKVLQADSLSAGSSFVTRTNFTTVAVRNEEILVDEPEGNAKFFKVIVSTNGL